MGERDYNQSSGGRNEGRFQNRDESRRDRDDDWRAQSPDRGESYRDERDYSRDYERNYGAGYPERNYGQSRAGYESRRFPGTFGSFDEQRYGRDYNRERDYESGRDYGASQDRGYSWDRNQSYRGAYDRPFGGSAERYLYGGGYRGYEADYRERGEHRERQEGVGQQLREAGQRFIGKMKRVFRSPKGYKRSDERIREDVNDRLGHEEQLDPSEIEVMVSNGEVTLIGMVESRREKFLAEEIADDVGGVSEVHNQLRVGRAQSQTATASGAQSATEVSRNRNARAE